MLAPTRAYADAPWLSFSLLLALAPCGCGSSDEPTPGPTADAADALVWGYPLVVTRRTMQSIGGVFGVNTLVNQPALSTASIHFIVSPNQDTLYSVAVVDLRSEPMVLILPTVQDRYWTYQFLDAWTSSFHYLGTRTTLGEGGTFVITPPGWTGTMPAGATQIAAPTPQLFVLGRYLVREPGDIEKIKALDRRLIPLSTLMGTAPPAPPPALGAAPGATQAVGTTGADFFDELGDVLADNPPANDHDRTLLERFQSLGIGPAKHPTSAGGEGAMALEKGVTTGMERILAAADDAASTKNGWRVDLDVGVYGEDTLRRAAVANYAWGANVPEESVYARASKALSGAPLMGAKRYGVHFDKGQLPPVDEANGFWSVTLYGPDRFFVENPLHRYAIGDRTQGISFNTDGSLDLLVQADAPAGKESNWLPAPPGEFRLMLRLYLPKAPVLDGSYVYPPVEAVE